MKLWHLFLPLSFFLVFPAKGVQLSEGQSGHIARIVGHILSQDHLRQERFNDELSKVSLQNYLNALDPRRRIFLKGDVEEFQGKYATMLDDLTKQGNARPAFKIFERYLERLEERVRKVEPLLEADHDFQADEALELDRSEKPWPATEEEADEIWRKHVKADILQGRLDEEAPEAVKERLTKRYTWLLKDWKSLEDDEILQRYLTAIGHAYDPHSDYMCPSEVEDFEINHVKLQLTGIGALLRSENGYCKIEQLVPGGPAAQSKKIKPKDVIIKVAQADGEPEDVVGMRLRKVVGKIRGTKDTEVRLTIKPADGSKTKVVSLIRDVIELEDRQASAKIIHLPRDLRMQRPPRTLAVILLPQYYQDSAGDVRTILQRLQREKVEGIVLDLRNNGGGILEKAVELTGLFFPKGPVVQVRNSRDIVKPHYDRDPQTVYDGPLVVLVNRQSASASEITAAALQDYGRAIIVGDQATHGKGTVQVMLSLNHPAFRNRFGAQPQNSGNLKFTAQNFYRVNGAPTQRLGVHPDIVLPSVFDYLEIGEEHLPNSMEIDEIQPARYVRLNRVAPYLENLKKLSEARVRQDQDFAYVREDIARFRKFQESQLLSLNEDERIAETEREEARIKTRKQERQNRSIPKESAFLLTLNAANEDAPLTPLPYLTALPAEMPEENAEKLKEPKPELEGNGSGFVIGRDGETTFIVTNHHVVEDCAKVTVVHAGKSYKASVRAKDANSDLALLETTIPAARPASFSSLSRARLGEAVTAAGYPLQGLLSKSLNVTGGNISALAGLGDDAKHLQITAPLQPGNSGGPLLDGSGNVIGVAASKLNAVRAAVLTGDLTQNVNFAIKAALVRRFLDIHGVDYQRLPSETKLEPEQLAERARQFTIAVHCWNKTEDENDGTDLARQKEEEEEEEEGRKPDPHLREALNILSDYVDALSSPEPE